MSEEKFCYSITGWYHSGRADLPLDEMCVALFGKRPLKSSCFRLYCGVNGLERGNHLLQLDALEDDLTFSPLHLQFAQIDFTIVIDVNVPWGTQAGRGYYASSNPQWSFARAQRLLAA